MSILIKGMEMPRNCWECEFCKTTTLEVDFCVLTRKQYNWALEERPSDCPLVEVPEDVAPVVHGMWIPVGHKLSRICSVCDRDEPYKFADDNANVYDYCPHCGAKMDLLN